MKLLKTLALIAAFGLSLSLTTQAAVRTDVWSGYGALTNAAGAQPDFTSAAGGILYSDADVLGGTNNSTHHQGATLWTGPMGPNFPFGLHDGYLYTFFAAPAMTITSNGVLEDVGYITLSISSNRSNVFKTGDIALTLDGSAGPSAFQFTIKDLGSVDTAIGEQDMIVATWSWELGATIPSELTLSWTTPQNHNAYFDITLTQSIEPIPEPSTWALLGAGLIATLWMNRRRKTRLCIGQ